MGIDPVKVGTEVDISGGLPGMSVVGLPDTAFQESRERVKAAVKNAGFAFPVRKVIVNLTPADLRKEGPCFDLPIAIGVLGASDQLDLTPLDDYLFLGELSLDGSLRPVAGVLAIAAAAQKLGIAHMIVPSANAQEAAVVDGLTVYGFDHLSDVVGFLNGGQTATAVEVDGKALLRRGYDNLLDLKDVKGQALGASGPGNCGGGGTQCDFCGAAG